MKNITIMGSTGSIGTQTLDIIEANPERFRATVLTAGSNHALLARQALKFRPEMVVIADKEGYQPLKEALKDTGIRVEAGAEALLEAAAYPGADTVVAALVGYSGLLPTIHAIRAGKTIALANKETLVVGGGLITPLLKKHGVWIVPVDSEHSAIFQCLQGEKSSEASKILLTASGGPFRTFTREQMERVGVADALKHPNWNMGAKVTIDSASMMNKGFEMIEARWLFDCKPEKIEILVHPQSIVHSMVEFTDGSVKAQLGTPDMHLPIQYALSYPERIPSSRPTLSLSQMSTLTFEAPDYGKFPLLGYAFEAIRRGGNAPAVLNAANEVAVKAFLDGKIGFTDMPKMVRKAMDTVTHIPEPTLPDLVDTHNEATAFAFSLMK